MSHPPLVVLLANILIHGNESVFQWTQLSPPKARLSLSGSAPLEEKEEDRVSSSSSDSNGQTLDLIHPLHFQSNPEMSDVCSRVLLCAILESLEVVENDYGTLFGIALLHAILQNKGTHSLITWEVELIVWLVV